MAMIYKILSGMDIEQKRMEMLSKNLAGAKVPGYKGENLVNQDFSGFADDINPTGQGTIAEGAFVDHSSGDLERTGRPLDFALNGKGFFELESLDGTQKFLTRNGRFTLNEAGELMSSSGYKVVGDSPLNFGSVNLNDMDVSSNGMIRVRVGQSYKEIGRIRVVDIEDKTNLEKLSSSLFRVRQGAEPLVKELSDGEFMVVGRSKEGSNISTVKEMITMISSMRKFEMGQKFLKLSDGLRDKEFRTFQ